MILKKVTPTFTRIFTTSDKYTDVECMTANGVIDPKKLGLIKDVQRVVAIGASCRFVKEGDLVGLTFKRYGRPVQKRDTLKESFDEHFNAEMVYDINTLTINGQVVLFLDEGDVEYIIEECEEVETAAVGALGSGLIVG